MNIDALPEDVRVELFNRSVASGTSVADLMEDAKVAFVYTVMIEMNYQLFDIIGILKSAGVPYFLKWATNGIGGGKDGS
jgi:hypothetical protein